MSELGSEEAFGDRLPDEVRALGRQEADAHGMVELPMTTRCNRLRRR